ncbi:unnamed protein product [Leuciscus chuanchicus]
MVEVSNNNHCDRQRESSNFEGGSRKILKTDLRVFVAGAGAPPMGSQLRKVSCWADETRPNTFSCLNPCLDTSMSAAKIRRDPGLRALEAGGYINEHQSHCSQSHTDSDQQAKL